MGLRAGVKKTFRLAMPCNSPGCSFQAKTQTPQCPTPLCPGRLFEDGGVGFLCLSGRSDAAPICLQAGLEQGPFKAPHLQGGPRHVLVLTSFRNLRPCAAAHAGGVPGGAPVVSPFMSSSQRSPWRPASRWGSSNTAKLPFLLPGCGG